MKLYRLIRDLKIAIFHYVRTRETWIFWNVLHWRWAQLKGWRPWLSKGARVLMYIRAEKVLLVLEGYINKKKWRLINEQYKS